MNRRWGIRNRVLLVAMLPAVALGITLIAFFTHSRIADMEEAHANRGRALTRQLAASAEFPLFSGNVQVLGRMAQAAVSETDVLSVSVIDAKGHALVTAHHTGEAGKPVPPSKSTAVLRMVEPVLPSLVDLGDIEDGAKGSIRPEPLGSIVLEFSNQRLADRRTELMAVGAIALGMILIVSLLLAQRMSASVTGPIRTIAAAVARIGEGRLTERVPVDQGGSLLRLSVGINEMASRLERSHESMLQQVKEATSELRARKDEAERATLAKSRFLAAASHDLRQPMHALGLFISELSQHSHQPEARRLVRQIAASAEAMEALLDSLLDISKLDAGVFKPNIRVFPLQPVLERLSTELRPLAEERQLRLRVRPTSTWVESDPALLERVLINLLSNALRYTPEGTVLIAARRRGTQIHIEVRDSGIGIAPEAQEVIFHEFVQLENAERARDKGLGLGLAIVRRLTELLGHELKLRSRIGAGSIFSVALPLAQPQPDRPPGSETERPPGDLAGTRIALVDDDPLALTSLHSLLLSWGCVVFPADSLENLMIELATRGPIPQIIISDYRLRGHRTGIDVIRAVRNRIDPDLPAILISGDTGADTLLQAQAEDLILLHKPVRPAKLRALLTRRLA